MVRNLFRLTAPARSSACEVRFFVADTFVVEDFSEDDDEMSATASD